MLHERFHANRDQCVMANKDRASCNTSERTYNHYFTIISTENCLRRHETLSNGNVLVLILLDLIVGGNVMGTHMMGRMTLSK